MGFPHWFDYTPSLTTGTTDLNAIDFAKFSLVGRTCHLMLMADNRSLSGDAGGYLQIGIPITANENFAWWGTNVYWNGSTYVTTRGEISSGVLIVYKGMAAGGWSATESAWYFRSAGFYEI